MGNIDSECTKVVVAQYLRMSTEHQQYSIENQEQFIKSYAEKHNMVINYTYNDAGKSGVTLTGRDGLKKLFIDVINHNISIQAVLVYDVSRFGRFQDPDEAAHYSFLLKEHNVRVIYCADPLSDEHPELSMITLPVLRYGAANYSKNLSDKVFIGQVNLVKRGYRQGGMCGYGLRRLLIDDKHNEKEILKFRQRKSIQTDRVILVPGPKNEIKIVNLIYNSFIFKNKPEYIIANELNTLGIHAENDTKWTRAKIHHILTNEKYIGNNVYNKTSYKLKQKYTQNPKDEWIRCVNAYKPIISKNKFKLAQRIIENRSKHLTDEDIFYFLKRKLKEKGKLSGFIIDEDETGPSSAVISKRFGGLIRAYLLIGYTPEHDYSYLEINNHIKIKLYNTVESFKQELIKNNCLITGATNSILKINDETSVSLVVSRCIITKSGKKRWKVRLENKLNPDITVIIRMDSGNRFPVDYYILPRLDFLYENFVLTEKNSIFLEYFRFDNLDNLYHFLSREEIKEVILNG